jgi:ankyrin repeat protein
MLRMMLMVAVLAAAGVAHAQTPPTPWEIAAYHGLHRAAQTGDLGELRRLIAGGGDINVVDVRGRTPAIVAAFAGQAEALRLLAAAGADMNAREGQGYDVLTIAAAAGNPALVSLAIALGDDPKQATGPYQGSALIAAAEHGDVEVARRLIAAGAPLDHADIYGWTPLTAAIIFGDGGPERQQLVKLLLDAGANRAIADRDGVTALEHARVHEFVAIERLLSPVN